MTAFTDIIQSADPAVRDRALEDLCQPLDTSALLKQCDALDHFRRTSGNLYERVRALFFLYAIHRFHLPQKLAVQPNTPGRALIPFKGYEHLLERRFQEAIDVFLKAQRDDGCNDGLSSALSAAYQRLGFQTLADQVRRSVRSVRGNQWMFRMGHPENQPLRIHPTLQTRDPATGAFPILRECTPVRMDLTHCGWSDIFFLGMDHPEGARVLNVSIDLGVHGRDAKPRPPVEAYLRVIDAPVLRLASVDLGCATEISSLAQVFDFAADYLGLLKAAVIASGLIPPGIEGSGQQLADLLAKVVGPGHGLELVSNVNNIPKGSRLAVSTNLLAALIGVCMRATCQSRSLTGPMEESERRIVLARALLGEWLGGSGGGWQDSGGVWPGIKLIEGAIATEGDPEFGISRGRLMPTHHVFSRQEISDEARQKLQDSLVLVHGGMAQNVGPILEMVTEKYLLRCGREWKARNEMMGVLHEILDHLPRGDIRSIGRSTTRNFRDPIQTIIPWATNLFTETLIQQVSAEFDSDFWGFWMLGGMSGGGMGFMFAPHRKAAAQARLQEIMSATRHNLRAALPFAMEPVVYDFAINDTGTCATLLQNHQALMPAGYYKIIVPGLLRQDWQSLSPVRRAELDTFAEACRTHPELSGMVQTLFDVMLPRVQRDDDESRSLSDLLAEYGFDRTQHERIRRDLKSGLIGLAQNRLPASAVIEDVREEDVTTLPAEPTAVNALRQEGLAALQRGEVAVVTLAAGAGSRWTQGAGTVKALHPFCRLGGQHRTFIELHLAKSRRISREAGTSLPHLFTTSYLSHGPIEEFLARENRYGYEGAVLLSPGKSIGLRLVPMTRDLRFAWEEMPRQRLDEQAQKMQDSLHAALIHWAQTTGEAGDYTDNLPLQCLHPVGHWYEIPNLLRNGVLAGLLQQRPQLQHLVLHNIDTVGMDVDPALLGLHLRSQAALTFEVITRRLEDRGGGLARVDGKLRLVEGLAMPREEEEFNLRYYNSNTCWIHLDRLFDAFGLTRDDLADEPKVTAAIRNLAARMPTYITLKDVKKRWGHGQEDVFPVCQFEKLWVDMTNLTGLETRYVVVPRLRGQQLKDPAQLDGWLRDGSAAHVESLCHFS
ncbi:MAG: UTP--glucose-1-phosphate uridylyltransferase [Verrucomicrobia bacterium]|jgi:hypothetical protein|nr:UTP--glucose-1-phosphate uridylyltransferase [Verrucomicrobiota bacterium]